VTTPPGLRLLVIDDEPDIIEVTRVSLELLGGHSVITASSARQGLILAQDAPPTRS
jgi:CheY-like chemotaxis protein